MPSRIDRSTRGRVEAPATTSVGATTAPQPGAAPARANGTRRPSDGFAPAETRSAAQVAVGRDGTLTVNGQTGREAMVSLARIIELSDQNPLRGIKTPDAARLYESLEKTLAQVEIGKPKASQVLERSAAATVLLQLAGQVPVELRERMLNTYVDTMAKERSTPFRMSMMVNLDASRLSLNGPALAKATLVREQLLPPRPPYEEWFKGRKATLTTHHYVMDEFWRSEVAAYKRRGFKVTSQSANKVEVEKVLKDPKGVEKDVTAKVTLLKGHENIFKDVKDPDVQMVLYSGHAQLGGVVESALATSPKEMAGTKLLQFYSCRGKQTAGEVLERFPHAHVTTTASSAYGSDDAQVLDATWKMLERRGDYASAYRDLTPSDMLQPRANYIFPNDARILAARDTDDDGIKDLTPLGADKFFDPSKRGVNGKANDLKPRATSVDPQALSGDRVDHAVSYANTAFFYFSEENRKSPLTMAEADRFVPKGWFKGTDDAPLRITEKKKDGHTYYEMAINTRYSGQSREALTAMVLYESQKYLCLKDKGRFSEDDKLRGLLLVGSYVDLFCKYSEDCDAVLASFGQKYGVQGADYATLFQAGKREGHHTGAQAAVDYLKRQGVQVPS